MLPFASLVADSFEGHSLLSPLRKMSLPLKSKTPCKLFELPGRCCGNAPIPVENRGRKGDADTHEKMKRKGSFLTRQFAKPHGPVVTDGKPTALALARTPGASRFPKLSLLLKSSRRGASASEEVSRGPEFVPNHRREPQNGILSGGILLELCRHEPLLSNASQSEEDGFEP